IPTESYVKETSAECRDLRQVINPKKCLSPDYSFRNLNAYRQVFNDKSAFIPNLSILDLLFNEGNLSEDYLKQNLPLFA
ncbi:MAG: WbqC family protein, partial [Bacteroidales bacterium]|nr:WbqC family protein [Bacteroidales bacterium]